MKRVNKEFVAQAIQPIKEITVLTNTFVGPVQSILLVLTVLIVIVAGVGIMVSIYNSMSERRHEIAVMRALGAHRGKIMMIVLAESILLSLGGGLIGWLAGHTLVGAAAPIITDYTGVAVNFLQFALGIGSNADTRPNRAGIAGRVLAGAIGLPDRRGTRPDGYAMTLKVVINVSNTRSTVVHPEKRPILKR